MELMLQRINGIEPAVIAVELLWVEVDVRGVAIYLLRNVFQVDVGTIEALKHLREFGVYALDAMKFAYNGAQSLQQPQLVAVEFIVGSEQSRLYFFYMVELLDGLFELFLLAFLQVCLLQLIVLKAQEVFVLPALGNLSIETPKLFLCLAIGLECLAVLIELPLGLRYDVDHTQLEVFLVKQKILMLRMYVDKLITQLL